MLKFCRDFYPLQKSWLIEPRFLCASKKGDSRWARQSTRCCWSKPTNFFTVMWWVLHYSSGQKFELLGNPRPLTASCSIVAFVCWLHGLYELLSVALILLLWSWVNVMLLWRGLSENSKIGTQCEKVLFVCKKSTFCNSKWWSEKLKIRFSILFVTLAFPDMISCSGLQQKSPRSPGSSKSLWALQHLRALPGTGWLFLTHGGSYFVL